MRSPSTKSRSAPTLARTPLGRHGVPLQLVRLNTELARLAADVEDVREALAGLLENDEDMAGASPHHISQTRLLLLLNTQL